MNKISNYTNVFIIALLLISTQSLLAEAPFINPADDASHFGNPNNLRNWSPEEQVAGFRNFDRIMRTRTIAAGGQPYPLSVNTIDLNDIILEGSPQKMSLDEYFVKQNVAGLLVIKNASIVYERYGLGNTKKSRWVSYSVAKSVVSMLVGAAIKDGYIASLDEMVTDYLPRLKGSPYAESSIRNILQMSSGVDWNENYADPNADINQVPWNSLEMHKYVKNLTRKHKPGVVFHYNTAESRIVGNLLRAAIGNNLSYYLSEKIWQPFGMEFDANWMLTEGGGESGGCCISATLRDYGRIGLFALAEGRLSDGTAMLPKGWMQESTRASAAFKGYGYLWWLGTNGRYGASGIHGQGVWVSPKENLVIALHSARKEADNGRDFKLQTALYHAIAKAVSD